jgi:hypothetical protein
VGQAGTGGLPADAECLRNAVPVRPVHGVEVVHGIRRSAPGQAFQGGGGTDRGQWLVGGQGGEVCLELVEEGGEVRRQGDGSGLYVGDVGVPVAFRAAGVERVRIPSLDGLPVQRVAGRAAPAARTRAPRTSVATGAPSVPS